MTKPEIEALFTNVFEAEKREPTWLIKDLLPVGLAFLIGPPKSKKSTMTAAMAALVSGHQCKALPEWLSIVKKTGPVLWFSYEASAGELRFMLEDGLGVKTNGIESIYVADEPMEFRLDDPDAMQVMMEIIEHYKPVLMICDPLAEMHELEEKDAIAMIRILRPLRKWAVDNNSSCVMVHHTRKPGDGHDGTYRALDARGSSALFGKADALLTLSPISDTSDKIKVVAVFKRGENWEREIVFGAYGKSGSEVLKDFDKQVIKLLDTMGEMKLDEVMLQLNKSETTVRDSLKRLERAKLVHEKGGKWIKSKK